MAAQLEQANQTILLATFFVGYTLYALDASGVQEVIRLGAVTPVRHAPQEVVGVINLRGKIVTLLDLAVIFGFNRSPLSGDSRIFIIEERGEFFGLLADRVGEVLETVADEREPVPANIPAAQARFFCGVFRSAGHVITLLNATTLLTHSGI